MLKERRVYTAEFKREAVRLSEQADVSVVQVAQEPGASDYSLCKWRTTGTSFGRKQARTGGELAFPGNGKVALSAEQQENQRLKRELERVTQELGPFGLGEADSQSVTFRKSGEVLCREKQVRYTFIKEHRGA